MIWNLGSINADNLYQVPHLPAAGETLAAAQYRQGLGGKGANMSVAAARGGAQVSHIGAVGADGRWAVDRLVEYGVDISHIATVNTPTGHAVVAIDEHGENSIILFLGANHALTHGLIEQALTQASPGDWVVMQNETNAQSFTAKAAKSRGMKVLYAAAPFEAMAVKAVLDDVDILVLNEIEARQLTDSMKTTLAELPVRDVIVTLGKDGCRWVSDGSERIFPAYPATAVDTTGAGDTFTGYLAAGLDRNMPMPDAIDLALKAGALMVSRKGTADVIPDLKEIEKHQFGPA